MIGLIAHVEKAGAGKLIRSVVECLQANGAAFILEKETAALAGEEGGLSVLEVAGASEVLVVMGGDGTILRVVHQLEKEIPPIFGINTGSLGFLTCLGAAEVEEALDSILKRNFVLSQRRLLRATLRHEGETCEFEGLNEVLVSRGERSQLVKLRVLIDGEVLTDYYADGLIVATPTGSTAYSLSSGGPILMPQSGSLVITPICPHVLTNRSVVVSDDSLIELEPTEKEQEVFVAVDGQVSRKVDPGDRVEIRKSTRTLPLAMLPGRSFSEVLRQKLKWSGSNI